MIKSKRSLCNLFPRQEGAFIMLKRKLLCQSSGSGGGICSLFAFHILPSRCLTIILSLRVILLKVVKRNNQGCRVSVQIMNSILSAVGKHVLKQMHSTQEPSVCYCGQFPASLFLRSTETLALRTFQVSALGSQ